MRSLITALPALGVLGAALLTCCTTMSSESGGVLRDHDDALPVSRNKVFAESDLIEVKEVDSRIRVDLRYKTADNFTGVVLYPPELPALLRPGTARRLARANRLVAKHGFYLKIWDAYRPPSVQRRIYDISGRNDLYVANPDNAPSQHSCGTAVDVTLVHKNGKPARMPTAFDAFEKAAFSDHRHPDPEVRQNLRILQEAMRDAGFYPLPAEWWHYIDRDYEDYPGTVPLERLSPGFQ